MARNIFITKERENYLYQKMVAYYEALNKENESNVVETPLTPEEKEKLFKAMEKDRQYYKNRPEFGRKERLNKSFGRNTH